MKLFCYYIKNFEINEIILLLYEKLFGLKIIAKQQCSIIKNLK